MPVGISCDIDETARRELDNLLHTFQTDFPRKLGTLVKRTGVDLCKSLGAMTKKAPKRIRRGEYTVERSPEWPTITNSKNSKHGRSAGKKLHRYRLTRKLGTPDQYYRDYFVYAYTKLNKKDQTVCDKTREIRELLDLHGGIQHAGLAKRSWRWAAAKIANGGALDTSYQMRKYDKRDPRKEIDAFFSKVAGKGAAKRILVDLYIENKLDYILDALKEGGFSQAVINATKSMLYKVNNNIEKHAAKLA